MAIFVFSFVGISQERISPVSVVSWGSAGTVLGWVLWDIWVGQEAAKVSVESLSSTPVPIDIPTSEAGSGASSAFGSTTPLSPGKETPNLGLGLSHSTTNQSFRRSHGHLQSFNSIHSASSFPSAIPSSQPIGNHNQHLRPSSPFSSRNQQRLSTAKSAILIYCALLGLSPILKSLTKSTTSDSIWAMSSWLMLINIFFFDYGGGVGVKWVSQSMSQRFGCHLLTAPLLLRFPASLSTNAALMASTVLASRLTSTTHVFSLTLFSIEVFGLFPVFRRHLRHISWRGHLLLTFSLVAGAGAGMGVTLAPSATVWKAAVVGILLWGLGTAFAMGLCSWWLIGLQRYKNVVIGPWDPARPIIRAGQWE